MWVDAPDKQEKRLSTSGSTEPVGERKTDTPPNPKRWLLLWTLATVQFIIFLDTTIVNVALPSIGRDLQMSSNQLTWVVNGYLLAAGSLLLLGGRIGDIVGRRKTFVVGALMFGVASMVAVASTSGSILLVGRVLQGVGEALAAPAALGIIALTFTDPKELQKAYGIWGGLSGLGAVAGVLLGGVITEFISWRWIFGINIPLAIIPALMIFVLVDESKMRGKTSDGPLSALLLVGGTVSLVDGILQVPVLGISAASTWVPLSAGLILLFFFFALQARSSTPLLPLSFLGDRVRGSGYLGLGVLNAATSGMFFLVAIYMQNILGYSPLQNGLAWIPYCVFFLAGIQLTISQMPKQGAKIMMITGLFIAALGMAFLAARPFGIGFWEGLLPGLILVGMGGGMTFPAAQTTAMDGLSMQDAGLGSGVTTTIGQIGQAVGLAVLTSIALGTDQGSELVASGVGKAMFVSAVILSIAAVTVGFTLRGNRADVGKVPA